MCSQIRKPGEYWTVLLSTEQVQALIDAVDTLDANALTADTADLDVLADAYQALKQFMGDG